MEARSISIHGHRIAYLTGGRRGPVVVLVHGIAGSSLTWTSVIERLSRSAVVLAPDLLGHGRSDKPRGDYSLGAHASVLRDLLVALGHKRATFVGHSLGGGIVMQLAYQYPERCERLVLVASGGFGPEVSRGVRAATLPGAGMALALASSPRVRRVGAVLGRLVRRTPLGARLPDRATAEAFQEGLASLADRDARHAFVHTLRAVVDANGQRVSAADRLYLASAVPTLIIWGAQDQIIPVRHAEAAHLAIPGSRLEVFPDAGHHPHRQDPERFARVLEEFLTSTRPARLSPRRWRGLLRVQTA